ncbi:complement C9 L homeolog isoform X2 [Xenopus laevis]|uniref:Complement component C9 n=2 Tax=Xenopus laevis TaxID=8355 RepID=A0A8J0VG71_XENLA|nr:complement C9 L homeolog isoform X2 [Xenopus laevis]
MGCQNLSKYSAPEPSASNMENICLLLGLTVLCAFVSGEPSFSQNPQRFQREVNAPAPIDCQLSSWGSWSQCDPCTKHRYRSRSVEHFGQYGGAACVNTLGDIQRCIPEEDCLEQPVLCGNDFECESGRCIKTRLLCNGDNDCGDYSDETCDDKDPKSPCRNSDIELSEIARTAGDGLNILGMKPRRNPFDNEYFNGICDRVRDGKTYFRKPWNVAALVYQTRADKSFTTETYHDAKSVMSKIIDGLTVNIDASVSLKLTPTENKNVSVNANAGIGYSKTKNIEKLRTYSETKDKTFMRVSGSVQLATFQMRTRGAMLNPTFIEDIKNLPKGYDKAEYFSILEMYGTHYSVSGNLGGKYELVYVLDSIEMNSRELTTEDIKDCLRFNADAGIGVKAEGANLDLNPKIKGDVCKTGGGESETEPSINIKPVIESIISFVDGGTVEYVTALEEKLNKKQPVADVNDYVQWASSLKEAPAVIKSKPNPIYSLIPTDIKDAYTKSRNLERAIEEYIDEYSVCKCQRCQNGGKAMVIDGECICKCPLHYEGVACQNIKAEAFSKPKEPIDGGWGCWTVSPNCVNGDLTATRKCDNPVPQQGGKTCHGSQTKTIPCEK